MVNPVAGLERVPHKAVERWLSSRGFRFAVEFTTREGGGAPAAKALLARGVGLLVVLGGDGTMGEVCGTFPPVPLLLLPSGRGNDTARSLYGREVPALSLLPVLLDARVKTLTLGVMRVGGRAHPFVNSAGVGFDGFVSYLADKLRVSFVPLSYRVLTFLAFPFAGPVEVSGASALGVEESALLFLSFGCGRYQGAGMELFPEHGEGELGFACAPYAGLAEFLAGFRAVLAGRGEEVRRFVRGRTRGVRLAVKTPFYAHADGQSWRSPPATVEFGTLPDAVRVLVPAKGASAHDGQEVEGE